MMDWWRAHHGLPNDPKLALSAAVTPCNATRGEVLAVFVSLLDMASQNTPRGSIEGYDVEQIGWMLQMDSGRVSDIIEALKKKRVITGNMLTSWEKRNPKRDREDDSAERVRKYRDKQKLESVTPCNATKRPEERRLEESNENQKHVAVATSAPEEFQLSADPPSPVRSVVPTGPTFEDWWKVWWNHDAKKDALKAWPAAVKKKGAQFLVDQAIGYRQRFEDTDKWEFKAKMLPATWLRGERWNDQAPMSPARNGPTPYRKDDWNG